jgi:hypothetical protein
MAFKWKTWTAGWLLMVCCLMLPAVLFAEEGAAPEAEAPPAEIHPDSMKMFGEPNPGSTGMDFAPPDGSPLAPPVTIRQWRIRDDDDEPYCFELGAGPWTTVLIEDFATGPSTTYIELDYSAQLNVTGGADPYDGIMFRARLVQNGVESWFPGGGEGFAPFLSRRDEGASGQFMFSNYVGMLYVDPDTETRLMLELRATDLDGTACFQNIIVRND